MKILVVEDEQRVAQFIQKGLKEEGHAVDCAYDGEEGGFLAEVNEYDLIILDLMLPKKSGLGVCAEIRERGVTTPVLMLTARDAVQDKVRGLDAGADDYLTKPFVFDELLARVRALLRRGSDSKAPILKIIDLELDPMSRRVTRGGKAIRLTTKEYALLEYMMRNRGRVLTRTMLLERVWDFHFDPKTNVVETHVSRLRSKVDRPFATEMIRTIRGSGYVLNAAS